MTRKTSLQLLQRFIGSWTTEATHPARPGLIVHGTATFEWLDGEQFLIQRTRTDQPEFPRALTVTGFVDRDRDEPAKDDSAAMAMHYYDSRGVFRTFTSEIDERSWRVSNDSPGFAQRFTMTLSDDGNTIKLVTELCTDGSTWKHDLEATYRRG